MSKKNQRNGFYYFMLDFKKREEKNGNKFASLTEIQANAKCSKEWQELSADQKKMYNGRAKKNTQEKKTGLGESVKTLEVREIENQKYETNMREYIDTTIRQDIYTNRIKIISFYFIHVHWYYTKTDMENVVDYIPAEFAVVEFSLSEGVKRCCHEIIKLKIEIGYAREAMEHSDEVHKIEIFQDDEETNYKDVYKKFYDFMTLGDKSMKKLPPLYTTNKMKTVVPCFFQRITDAAGVPADTFDLYSLEYLFGTLMMELNEGFPETGNRTLLAEAELNKGAFDYVQNIGCAYHNKLFDIGNLCCQAIVTQWAYTLCDAFCPILNIKMIEGIHCPDKDVNRKRAGGSLTITYGQTDPNPSIIVPSASSSVSNYKAMGSSSRAPISLSQVLVGVEANLVPNDEDFPEIGSSKFKSRSKKN
ncbi:Similar to mael: Protein maelstrom homolog (Culex quinquefasciatus) [Cotesia congregata]|uniref:Similar to mael: Protein maelstrom homolog (Culex quinquefasciatus) n=1 Tax=Cotesia congregata TaxID=51543 RepID=A0A8J2HCP5_COTCN|nr:Similar to mael: Protein maelstrom homolog (Culex quinquefasciatus) [Cotesia congregata]